MGWFLPAAIIGSTVASLFSGQKAAKKQQKAASAAAKAYAANPFKFEVDPYQKKISKLMYQNLQRSTASRRAMEPEWQRVANTNYTPNTQEYDRYAQSQYGWAKQTADKEYGNRADQLDEYMSRRGIFYSGANDREQRELGKEKSDNLRQYATELALQNIEREQAERQYWQARQFDYSNLLNNVYNSDAGGATQASAAVTQANAQAAALQQAYNTQLYNAQLNAANYAGAAQQSFSDSMGSLGNLLLSYYGYNQLGKNGNNNNVAQIVSRNGQPYQPAVYAQSNNPAFYTYNPAQGTYKRKGWDY